MTKHLYIIIFICINFIVNTVHADNNQNIAKILTTKIYNDASEQFVLAEIYFDDSKYNKAIELLKKSAQQNYLPAQIKLASWYYFGYGSAKINYKKARFWYEKAANIGDDNAQLILANMYRDGEGGSIDNNKAFNWYLKSEKQGNIEATYYLGFMYLNGKGVVKNDRKAFLLVQKSALDSYPYAQYTLAQMYKQGLTVMQNTSKYLAYLIKSAKNNFAKAQYELANHYYFADNKQQAAYWMEKAYQQNYPNARNLWHKLNLETSSN